MSNKPNYSSDFGPFGGRIWINCAHQGPIPQVTVKEAQEAIGWKIQPFELTTDRFSNVPARLKKALGTLIGAPADEIILGNSASYGLHLIANGIKWSDGDEVLLMKGDFPSDILPWLGLEQRGVRVKLIEPRNHVISPDELRDSITPATRLFCTTLVHSLSGYAIDAVALGEICQARNVRFMLNASQALGCRPFDVTQMPVDALTSVGFKWLCGPYGTGFCWIKPELRESLEYNQSYWLSMQTADDLGKDPGIPTLRKDLGARRYDVFGTANFFNFKPWTASVEYVLAHGVENIQAYDTELVTHLIGGLDRSKYDLLSPEQGLARSTLVFISHKDALRNQEMYSRLREEGVFIAYRAGKLRLAPHFYNTIEEIDRALSVLNSI